MPTRRTHEYDPNKLTSLSVQLPNWCTQRVHEAAQKAGVSTAMFVGQASLDAMCDLLGRQRLDIRLIKSVTSVARHGSADATNFIRRASHAINTRVEEASDEDGARAALATAEALFAARFDKTQAKKSGKSGEYESASFRAAPKVSTTEPSKRRK